jgi:hypothetical protein
LGISGVFSELSLTFAPCERDMPPAQKLVFHGFHAPCRFGTALALYRGGGGKPVSVIGDSE